MAHWFYALSLGLLALLATQGIIVDGHKLRPAAATHGLGTLVGPAFCIFRQFNLIYRPAATWTAVIIIACPVAAKCVGAAVNRLVAP